MRLSYSAFLMPHAGEGFSYCADRFGYNEGNNCFSIADGVSQSLFPEIWAKLVCDRFLDNPKDFIDTNGNIKDLHTLVTQWENLRDDRISKMSEDEKFIFEMGCEKCRYAACTFVGFVLDAESWNAWALGDSYLFVLNEQLEILDKVSSLKDDKFSVFLDYFSRDKVGKEGSVVSKRGSLKDVAYFVLMTDALAEWFLSVDVDARKEFIRIKTHDEFERLVVRERNCKRLKDDDSTAVVITVEHDETESLQYSRLFVDDIDDLIQCEESEKNECCNTNDVNSSDLLDSNQECSDYTIDKNPESNCSSHDNDVPISSTNDVNNIDLLDSNQECSDCTIDENPESNCSSHDNDVPSSSVKEQKSLENAPNGCLPSLFYFVIAL